MNVLEVVGAVYPKLCIGAPPFTFAAMCSRQSVTPIGKMGGFLWKKYLKKIRAKFVNKTSQFWGSSQQFKRREVGSRPIACLPPPSLLKKFVYCTIGMPSFTALGVLRCIERS